MIEISNNQSGVPTRVPDNPPVSREAISDRPEFKSAAKKIGLAFPPDELNRLTLLKPDPTQDQDTRFMIEQVMGYVEGPAISLIVSRETPTERQSLLDLVPTLTDPERQTLQDFWHDLDSKRIAAQRLQLETQITQDNQKKQGFKTQKDLTQ